MSIEFEPLKGQLPKEYDKFDDKLLEVILRTFEVAGGFIPHSEHLLLKAKAGDSLRSAGGVLTAVDQRSLRYF